MKKEIYQVMFENQDDCWIFRGWSKVMDSLIKQNIYNKENKILDVGCGTGSNLKLLSKYGSVYGVDASEHAIKYASSLNIAELKQGGIESLPYDDNSFDMVFCIEVIYHDWVKNKDKALSELYRVLKKDGILVIREPAYNWLRSHHDTLFESSQRFTKDKLSKKMDKVGFGIIKKTYANTFLFPLALIKRVFERKVYSAEEMFPKGFLFDMFYYVFVLEAKLLKFISFPFGLSVICIGKKE